MFLDCHPKDISSHFKLVTLTILELPILPTGSPIISYHGVLSDSGTQVSVQSGRQGGDRELKVEPRYKELNQTVNFARYIEVLLQHIARSARLERSGVWGAAAKTLTVRCAISPSDLKSHLSSDSSPSSRILCAQSFSVTFASFRDS